VGLLYAKPWNSGRVWHRKKSNYLILMQRDPGRFANTGKTGLANFKLDLHLLDWLRDLLRMPEEELIRIAGLDAVLVLRVIALRSGGHHCLDNQLDANVVVVNRSRCDLLTMRGSSVAANVGL
jgi:hypothetical protein